MLTIYYLDSHIDWDLTDDWVFISIMPLAFMRQNKQVPEEQPILFQWNLFRYHMNERNCYMVIYPLARGLTWSVQMWKVK